MGWWRWIFSGADALIFHITCNSIANRVIATWIKLSIIVMRWKYTKPHSRIHAHTENTSFGSSILIAQISMSVNGIFYRILNFSWFFSSIYNKTELHRTNSITLLSPHSIYILPLGSYFFVVGWLVCCRFVRNIRSLFKVKILIHTVNLCLIVPKFRCKWSNGRQHH